MVSWEFVCDYKKDFISKEEAEQYFDNIDRLYEDTNIIDDEEITPLDFWKARWDDEDDLISDYEEIEIEIEIDI